MSLLLGSSLSGGFAYAGPESGVVAGGNASISQVGNNTTINQTSQRALIDWQSFNVGQNEAVYFIQNNSNAIVVNRIHDAKPSTILGSINANGQIMLINPNGVVFGNESKVDVGSLVVSTASPTDSDVTSFVAGQTDKLNLSVAGNASAKIINNGNITAKDAGLVGFVSPHIINNGIIIASKGSVQLASGDLATLDLYGDGLIDIAVSDDVRNQLIEQSGWIEANGGQVIITAAAGEQVVNSIINMDGVTQAHSVEQQNGKIILKGDSSSISVTGTIDTSGYDQNQKGGSITITAKHINLKSGSLLNASGDKGGGSIKVGGDYQGKGTLSHAQTVSMEQRSIIHNDAITDGDGGQTILWSDDHTYFRGDITGKGGANSGHGGLVETSGKNNLTATGHIDLSAAHGAFGTWLLDPTNITIYNRSQGGTDNVNTLTTAYLEGQVGNISLVADNNIILNLTGDTLTGTNKDISLTATNGTISSMSAGSIVTTGIGSISLNAVNGINLNHTIGLTTSGGNISLNGPLTLGAGQSWNASTGTMAFGGTVNGSYSLTAIANAINFNGAWGETTGLDNITLTSVDDATVPNITTAAGKTVNLTVTGALKTLTTGSISTGTGGNISLVADDIVLNGDLTGTGNISLQSYTPGRLICVNTLAGACGAVPHLDLTASELARVTNNWSNIYIGQSSSELIIGASTWMDPVTFTGGIINVRDIVTGTGNASFVFNANNWVDLGSNIITDNQNVTMNKVVGYGGEISTNGGNALISDWYYLYAGNAWSINTGGGNITLGSGISNSTGQIGKTLTLNAGAGTINFGSSVDTDANVTAIAGSMVFNGNWGYTNALGTVSLTSINSLVLPSINANNILAMTTGNTSDITLGSGRVLTSSSSGTGVTLVAKRNFINQNGSSGLVTNGGGRWLVYSTDPTGTTGEENLASNFNRYGCIYSGGCAAGVIIAGTGNGLIYSYTPILTIIPTAISSIEYGSAIPSLSGYAYSVSGYLAGEGTDSLTGSINGSTLYTAGSNIGTYDIDYASGALLSALGYGFTYANNNSGFTVTPASLTITANSFEKLANTQYNFAGNEYSQNGLLSGDSISSVALSSSGAASNATVAGNPYAINASNATGTGLSNYNISYVSGVLTITEASVPDVLPVLAQIIRVISTPQGAHELSENTPHADEKQDDPDNCLYQIINYGSAMTGWGGCS